MWTNCIKNVVCEKYSVKHFLIIVRYIWIDPVLIGGDDVHVARWDFHMEYTFEQKTNEKCCFYQKYHQLWRGFSKKWQEKRGIGHKMWALGWLKAQNGAIFVQVVHFRCIYNDKFYIFHKRKVLQFKCKYGRIYGSDMRWSERLPRKRVIFVEYVRQIGRKHSSRASNRSPGF